MFRDTPFLVVIANIERIELRPGAAWKAVGMEESLTHSQIHDLPGTH
jgi:hypothetical protein